MLKISILKLGEAISKGESSEIRMLFFGDLCPILTATDIFRDGNNRDIYGDYVNLLKNKDLSIVNLESPLTNYNKKIKKSGINLKAEPETVKGIKSGFFDICNLGNNHILDYFKNGLYDTIDTCRKNGLVPIGFKESIIDPQELYVKSINGFKIGILSYAEGEFSKADIDSPGANPLDLIDIYEDLKRAKTKADFLIVLLHAGNEHYNLPNPYLKKICHHIIDLGADLIVGTHTHLPGVYEIYNNQPIFYSLGNFIFPDLENIYPEWNLGYGLQLLISSEKQNFEYNLIPYKQSKQPPLISELDDKEFRIFKEKMNKLNEIIKDEKLFLKEWEKFYKEIKNSYIISILFPSKSHAIMYKIIHRLNFLFRKFGSKRMLVLDEYLNCLSAQEALREILKDFNGR